MLVGIPHFSGTGAAIASFDYSAAFDTIDKNTVQQRLEDIGAHDNVKKWMASYMSGGRQKVRWNGAVSTFLDRLYGVAPRKVGLDHCCSSLSPW